MTKLLLLGFALDEPGEGPPKTPLPMSMSLKSPSISTSGSGSEVVVGLPLPVAPGLTPLTGMYEPSRRARMSYWSADVWADLVGLSLRGSPETLRLRLWPDGSSKLNAGDWMGLCDWAWGALR